MKTLPIPTITNRLDAILFFIQKLDIEMIDLILKDELTYQDFKRKSS